ncbi:MAG: hypothetical protein RLZ12_515 [Bacillota bacterium]|jgi:HAD superfamily phosphatase (TIGR01668 family)
MLRNFLPNLYLGSIYQLQANKLKQKGIDTILIDLDNTLVTHVAEVPEPALSTWIVKMKAAGFKMIIISNNTKRRVSRWANKLCLPYIHLARKPFRSSFKQALGILNSAPHQAAVMGDQLCTDILGGNRMMLFTILVKPLSATDSWPTRLNRYIEKIVVSYLLRKTNKVS